MNTRRLVVASSLAALVGLLPRNVPIADKEPRPTTEPERECRAKRRREKRMKAKEGNGNDEA